MNTNHSNKELMAHLPSIDVIAVQSAGLRQLADGTYASTTYSDVDEFGMLGGHMRILAAKELYWHSVASAFVFCNGKSAKQIAKFGPDVPTDAEIYAAEFRNSNTTDAHTKQRDLPKANIYLEDTSVNTVASIRELLVMCDTHGWKQMGLVSSDYHIPRIKALCDLIFKNLDRKPVEIIFISAEAALKELRPGVYDEEIESAYQTHEAHDRIKNEENGCNDIRAGRYHIGEFQLAPKS